MSGEKASKGNITQSISKIIRNDFLNSSQDSMQAELNLNLYITENSLKSSEPPA